MNTHRMAVVALAVAGCCATGIRPAEAQCCLSGLFSGCKKPPAYAIAPVAPVAAPVVMPVAAPPQPVMVPVQQTSYVPETTYRTEYKCVPVTSYKPSCEIDPCTGCTVECMQPVTQYVQQAVNVPVTQYRAVTTTKYVQMQPGYAGPPAAGMPAMPVAQPVAQPAASPFSAVQTTPQAWGAAGADVSRQPLPGMAPPALPSAPAQAPPTYQYQPVSPPAYAPQPPMIQGSSAQTITPQAGTYAPAQPLQPVQPQPTQPPALSPAPSLRPIPELPRTGNGQTDVGAAGRTNAEATRGGQEPAAGGTKTDSPSGMPVLPGEGPGAATGAFPRLLEPTSHTTSWGPSDGDAGRIQYPTAALPAWRQAQR